jgi:hypothetical protein
MKTAVDKVKKGKARIVNTRFAAMASHYLFDPDFCNVASAAGRKASSRRTCRTAGGGSGRTPAKERFGSFAELNVWLLARCRALWQELRHPEYEDLTIAEMLEHEQPQPDADGDAVRRLRRDPGQGLQHLPGHRGPQPLLGAVRTGRADGQHPDLPGADRLRRHDAVVASHPRSFERKQVRYDWQHYIPLIERKPGALRNGAPFADMPEPLQRLRGLLLKREGGDRIMAKVLAAVPQSGLEAVLVAVELVLESGNPSAEHVENVLNRLKRPRRRIRSRRIWRSPRPRLRTPAATTACVRR